MSLVFFKPWRPLEIKYDREAVGRFFFRVAQEGAKSFREGMDGPHTGEIYNRGGRLHQASVNVRKAEYPASDSGALKGTIKGRSTRTSATIGTNMPYSPFLREGTSRMRRRKMSDDALRDGVMAARGQGGFRDWVRWNVKGTS